MLGRLQLEKWFRAPDYRLYEGMLGRLQSGNWFRPPDCMLYRKNSILNIFKIVLIFLNLFRSFVCIFIYIWYSLFDLADYVWTILRDLGPRPDPGRRRRKHLENNQQDPIELTKRYKDAYKSYETSWICLDNLKIFKIGCLGHAPSVEVSEAGCLIAKVDGPG